MADIHRRGAPGIGLLLALAASLASPLAAAARLVPPPGFYAPAETSRKSARPCPPMPAPHTGKLEFPSKYEGSDRARDDLNPQAEARYRAKTAPINAMEKQVSAMVADYLRTGQEPALACALDWLTAWSEADALLSPTKDHTGRSVRKWTLASLASSYLRLKFSSSQPLKDHAAQAKRIEQWFGELAAQVVKDWKNQPLDKINNHEYWAAWAVMAAGVALDRRDLFDWALQQYRIAATQVDAEGYLPNELKRETRALSYHNYALGPLTMIAAFASANGVQVLGEGNGALKRLAERVLKGLDDPAVFEQRAGAAQELGELRDNSKFAWLEPYCSMLRCEGPVAQRLASLRPMKTYRLGGNVTQLFAPPGSDPGKRAHKEGALLRRSGLPSNPQPSGDHPSWITDAQS